MASQQHDHDSNTCSWTAISPLHPEYPLGTWSFAVGIAASFGFGVFAGLVACEAFEHSRVKNLRGIVSGIKTGACHGMEERLGGKNVSRAGRLLTRRVLLALFIATTYTSLLLLLSTHTCDVRLSLAPETASSQSTAGWRPRVVIMMPTRKGLHPVITKRARACLHAMEVGNPELDIEVFIFDRIVPRIAADKRPLSKVSRIRNMMVAEAGVSAKYDYTLWLDSDVVEYPSDLPTRLIRENPDGVTAPLVLIEEPGPLGTDQFYDTTAFVKRGRSNFSKDTSPFVKGRNIDRHYPYVKPEGCGDYNWSCPMRTDQELDSVGTIYMVSADIFRVGKAVFADHQSFTEHFPLMEHAWRMGRRVVVSSRTVARHANLPFYGEGFHDNVIVSGNQGLPHFLRDAPHDQVESWMTQVTSAYCSELGRLPDIDGMINYMQVLHKGLAHQDGEARSFDQHFIRSILSESDEAAGMREKENSGRGKLSVLVNFSSNPVRQHDLFSVTVACQSEDGCVGGSMLLGADCSKFPRSNPCIGAYRAGSFSQTTYLNLSLHMGMKISAGNGIGSNEDIAWLATHGILAGYPYTQLLASEARFHTMSINTSGVYRLVVTASSMGESVVVGMSSIFLVVSSPDGTPLDDLAEFSQQGKGSGKLAEGDMMMTEEEEGKQRSFIVFAHSTTFSKATDDQLLEALDQAALVHPGWQLRVYVDDSVQASLRAKLESQGVDIVEAGGLLPDKGAFTWAFWPFLAAEDTSVSRFLVREAGFDVIERERPAVQEWVVSRRMLHVARDSVFHDSPFNPRTWGCMHPCTAGLVKKLGGMRKAVIAFLDLHGAAVRTDFWFGDTVIWPSFSNEHQALAHDSVSCTKYHSSLPFPSRRRGTDHVGQQSLSWKNISSNGDDVQDAVRDMGTAHFLERLLNEAKPEWTCQRAPFACRKEFSWLKG